MRGVIVGIGIVIAALATIGLGHGCGGGDYVPVLRTTVKWELNQDTTRGFPGDGCVDLGVSKVRVDIAGPTSDTQDVACSEKQAVFLELDPGTYNVTVTPLDSAGASMVSAPLTGSVSVADEASEVTVVVPYTSWLQAYTGTFQFKLTWGGQPCAMAVPPTATQVLTLLVGGTPVAQVTDTGQHLDGADPAPCRPSTDNFPQMVMLVPLGPATLIVEGRDAGGTRRYMDQFETFIGAGQSNPTFTFDLPGPPDAAVDAI